MPENLSPTQRAYLNYDHGPIGKVFISKRGNPGPGLAWGLENTCGQSLDIGHFLAIPTEDGQTAFAVTLEPDVLSDLDPDEWVMEVQADPALSEPMTARPVARAWKLSMLCNTAGTSRPAPFAPIYFASRQGVDFALGQNRIPDHQRIPVGVIVNGDDQAHPVYIHAEYLLGPQGVHANWGGLSGLSGKTSKKALLELAVLSLRARMGLRCAIIVFSTKGTDELFRDIPADPRHPFWREHPDWAAQVNPGAFMTTEDTNGLSDVQLYDLMGLSPQPFGPVRLYVPYGEGQWWGYRTPETSAGLGTAEIHSFQWSLRQIANYMTLFASTDVDDKMKALEAEVLEALHDGYWADQKDNIPEHRTIHTLADLQDFFDNASQNLDGHLRWNGHHVATIARTQARYQSIFQRAAQVVNSGTIPPEQSLPISELRDGMVWVIDLCRLKDEAKLLVIYKVLTELYDAMQSNRLPLDRLLLDIDELNQHAPRGHSTPTTKMITAKLQDIAERARTEGMILLTAQQTLSAVDDRVEANIATRFYGMMSAQEAHQPIYGFNELERLVIGKLEPGEMLVQHPLLRHRVKVRVPRPTFIRGKEGQALLRPAAPVDPAARLQRLMAGNGGRALPSLNQVRSVLEALLAAGGSMDDLEQAARKVGQCPPLKDERNTGQATLNLFRKILGEQTGLSLPTNG